MSLFTDDDDWLAGSGPSRATSRGATPSAAGGTSFLSRLAGDYSGGGEYGGEDGYEGDEGREDGGGMGGGRDVGGVVAEEQIFSVAALSPGLEEDELDDVRRLARIWVRERGTPGLLRWEGEVLDSLLDKLEQQNKMIATLRADPATSEEEHFRLVLVQTEMERAKFLVRSYVRTRLHKVEKFAQHITASPELHPLLSGAELQHATRYTELLTTHFSHSVLDSLPEWLRKMDDKSNDGVSMVSTPDLNTPVLVYCRRDCGEITLERGEVAVLARGTTHLVRYNLVERWVQLGWAEVL